MTNSSDFYASLPKVELHRHLEGSLRLATMLEIAHVHGLVMPENPYSLSQLVQVQEEEALTYQNFLAKFSTLRLFYRSPEIIRRITREAIEDAAKDEVYYLELRFTPVALSRAEGFALEEVMDWVCESANQAEKDFGVTTRLIASVNRHEDPRLAEQVALLAAERLSKGVVGLDLAGNEAEFPAAPFLGIFNAAKQAGLHITIHAGEWGGAENVRQAIEDFGADRVAHGIRVMEDERVVALARERQTAFEVCLTSNYQTGVVARLADHPLMTMLEAGLNLTLGTDDPSISKISLSSEYRLACEILSMPLSVLKERILAAAQATFLPEAEQLTLINRLKTALQ